MVDPGALVLDLVVDPRVLVNIPVNTERNGCP